MIGFKNRYHVLGIILNFSIAGTGLTAIIIPNHTIMILKH